MMFGLFHLVVFLLSALLWMLQAAWNTQAAAWGMAPVSIGLLNFVSYLIYVISALALAPKSDRWGSKRPMAAGLSLFAVALVTGLFWSSPAWLFLTAGLATFFYGFFFPCAEGLFSRMEAREGADPAGTTARFSLSYSAGNIFGMISGPALVIGHPSFIFLGGAALCLALSAAVALHFKRHGEKLPGSYGRAHEIIGDPGGEAAAHTARRLRGAARVGLLLATLAFFGMMFLYPKIMLTEGVEAKSVGLYAAWGNLAVFAVFLVMARTRFWIGRPAVTSSLSALALAAFSAAFILPSSRLLFALIPALGGIAYAVPYTFAIYYGLHTPDADNAKQGAIHETLIGLGIGTGPLAAGALMGAAGSWRVLGLLIAVLAVLSFVLQIAMAKTRHAEARG
jgi:predicted MFS family arabinose efflux permease